MITAARDIRGSSCFGEWMFPHGPALKYVYHQYSQGSTCPIFKDFSRKHFHVVGFTLLSTVFRTICISVSCSRKSQNISSWKGPTKFIRNTKPNSCDWKVFKNRALTSKWNLVPQQTFLSYQRSCSYEPTGWFQSNEQHNLSKWEVITLISELWQNWAIQCLECSSWAASCKDPSACCCGKGAGGGDNLCTFTSLILLLVWKLIVDFCMIWFGFVVLCLHVNSRHLDGVLTAEWPRWK